MEIIQITDLHITKDIENIKNNCKPYLTLSNTLKHIKEHYPQVKNIVITGDLSNDYSQKSYVIIKDLLKIYEFDIFILPGNHDSLDRIQAICDDQISTDSIDLRPFNILAYNFDTHVPGKINGNLKRTQINELKNKLNRYTNIHKIIIFTHHPVTKINSKWIDKHICENSEELLKLMLSYDDKEFKIFSGHVHQEFDYRKNNIEFFTTPSTCYQFKKESEDFALEDNLSYGYRVITSHDNNIKTKVIRI
jgi:Icc protein